MQNLNIFLAAGAVLLRTISERRICGNGEEALGAHTPQHLIEWQGGSLIPSAVRDLLGCHHSYSVIRSIVSTP